MNKKLKLLLLALIAMSFPFCVTAQDWHATAPYYCDFENHTENGAWILLNGDSTVVNRWYIDTVAGSVAGGSKSLYVSDLGGATYNYDNSIPASVIAYRDFTLTQGSYIVSFDWNGVGELLSDYLLAALVPADDTTTLVGGTQLPRGVTSMSLPEGWISLGQEGRGTGLCQAAGWNRYQKVVDVPASQNYKLLFIWTNDYADGGNPPAAVDNISLRQVTCFSPSQFTAQQGVASIALAWTPRGGESQWIVQNGDTSYVSYLPSYTIDGLQPNTTYTFDVRAICSDGDTSMASSITATTGVTIPYFENFDSLDASFPPGWSYTLTGDSAYATSQYAPRVSGGSLVIDGFGYVVLPIVDTPVDTLQLSFSHSTPYGLSHSSPLVLGVMEGNNFVPVDTIADPAGGTYTRNIYFNGYQGTGRHIAFRNHSDNPDVHHATHYIDNVAISFLPSCFPVGEVYASADSSSLTLGWTPIVSPSEWIVTLWGDDDTVSRSLTSDSLSTQFTGLAGNTLYTYSIRALCGVGDTSVATRGTVRTHCSSIPHADLPYSYGFEDEDGEGLCWRGYSNTDLYTPYPAYGSARSGDRSYSLSSSMDAYSYVVLPLFQDAPANLMLSFWMCAAGSGDDARLVVGVMDDPDDRSSFTPVDTIICSAREMTFFEVPLANYSGNGRNIAILCDSGLTSRAFVDDVTVEVMPTCSRVRDMDIPVVTAGAALVNWNAGRIGEYQGAAIQIRDTLSDTWFGFHSDSTEYLVTNLFHNSAYEIRVAAICQNGDSSLWINSFFTTAMTNCNIIDSTSLTTDTISGFSNSNHFEFPVHNWHNYSFSEQLFTRGEIDTAGSFSAIEFFYAADTLPMSVKDSCMIYMGITSQATLDRTNYLNPSDMTLVYSGPMNCSYGWNTFAFNRGFFNYDGRSNLVVAVVDYSGAAHNEKYRFACHSASGKSVSFFSDQYSFDNLPLMSAMEYPYRNNIVLHTSDCGIESECYPPMLFVDEIGTDEISFTIIPGGYETSWDIQLSLPGDTSFNPVGSTSQSEYTIVGLEPSTTYTVRVVGDCEDNPSSDFTVTTRCMARTVPFHEDFASWPVGGSPIVPSCWYKYSSLGPNTPYVYPWSVGGHESALSLFSNAESYSLVALPELLPAIDSLQISFLLYREDNAGNPQQSDHRLLVGVMAAADDHSSFHPLYTVTATVANTWQLFELSLDTLAYDTTLSAGQLDALRHGRIALLSPDGIYSRPFVDDITVDYIPRCLRPSDITIAQSLSTDDSVCFTWAGTGSNAGYLLSIDSTEIYSPNNYCHVGGLNPSMVYTVSVRGICEEYGADNTLLWRDTSEATTAVLRTPCGKIAHSPWFEGFELNPTTYYFSHTFAKCWTRINDSVNFFGIPHVSDDKTYNRDCHTGDRGLAWIASPDELYGDNQYIVSPEIDTASLPINTLQLSFWAHANRTSQNPLFEVGVMNNGDSDGTSFVPVDTILIAGTTSWQRYTVYFNAYQGNATHVAIKASRPDVEWEASIDDIEIRLMPLCPPVSDIVASGIDTNTLAIVWTDHSTAVAWEVEYGIHGFALGTGVQTVTSSTSLFIAGLSASTLYDVYIRPVCGDDALYTMATFATADPYVDIPFVCNFSNPETNSQWFFAHGQHVNSWTIGSALGNGDSESLYISQDGGVTNSYNTNVSGTSFAYVNLNIPDSGVYNYRFDWRSNGQSQFDYLRVALAPISFMPLGGSTHPSGFGPNSLPLNWVALDGGSQLYGDTTGWQTVESEVHIATPGIYRMLFVWIDDYIAVGHQSPAAIDNVVFRHNSCLTPSDLSVIPYDDSVLVSWNANGDESAWIVTCDSVGIVATTTSLMITGLTANSNYQVSVRAFCIEGDTSLAIARSFHTTCHPVSLPYSENFDSHTSSTTPFTGVFPSCWSETVIGTQGNRNAQLYYGSDNAHSGNYSLFIGKEAYVALPPMPVPLCDVELSFHHLVNNSDFGFEVGVLEGDSFIPLASFSDPEETYVQHSLTLGSYHGGSRIIAFHNTNPISIGSPNFVDDIHVDYIPPCLPVSNIHAPVISTDNLLLDWTDASPALYWQIEYGVSGFAIGSGDTLSAATHPVAVSGLDTMTTYDFYVRGYCGDSSYSIWSGPVQLSTSYCDDATSFFTGQSSLTSQYLPLSTGYNYSATEFIIDTAELSGIGDINAVAFYYGDTTSMSAKDSVTIWLQPTSASSFANDNGFIPLNPNTAVEVYSGSLNCHHGWNFFNFTSPFVWDGLNNLLLIIDDNSGSNESPVRLFNVAQCSGYKSISYRSMTDNIDPQNPTGFYGFKSLYNARPVMQLIACGNATCHPPVDLAASPAAWDSVSLSWRGTAPAFEVALKRGDDSLWPDPVTVLSASAVATVSFSGLDEMTAYDYRVRQLCSPGVTSDWAEDSFTTPLKPCLTPSELSLLDLSFNHVTVDWQSHNPSAVSCLLLSNNISDTLIFADHHPFSIYGLSQDIHYSIAVADSCANNGSFSSFSQPISFTTSTCPPVSDVELVELTSSSALISWTGNGMRYSVEYGPANFSQGEGTTVDDVDTNVLAIGNLLPDHSYDVYVRTKCDDATFSVWSERLTFRTQLSALHSPLSAPGSQLSIRPNPAKNNVSIEISGITGDALLTIVDMGGRTVHSQSLTIAHNQRTIPISLGNIPAGNYFVHLVADNCNIVRKLVIVP